MALGARLIKNTAMLTASSLLVRIIGLTFQVWLAGRIGSAGIGLFQLVMSVGMLGNTVAISGIRFAGTRLLSEELGAHRPGGVKRGMHRCLAYSVFFGTAACIILWCVAKPVGFLWIGDARTVLSLKIFACTLPFTAVNAAWSGYFTATGNIWKSAASSLAEEFGRVVLVVVFLSAAPADNITLSCAAIVSGGLAAEIFGFAVRLLLARGSMPRAENTGGASLRLTPRLLGIALPLAASAYARSSLSMLQNLLVPRGFRASGLSADRALADYGVIQGMVMPILFFPSCLLLALAELLVPELTEAQVQGRLEHIRGTTRSLLKKCFLFSAAVAGGLWLFAYPLGTAVYSSTEAGHFIRVFAPLVPVMYLDMVIDGCLKGLGQMLFSMAINILEAFLGVLLVMVILPAYALDGYIAILYFGEMLNFSLSLWRLRQVLQAKTRSA